MREFLDLFKNKKHLISFLLLGILILALPLGIKLLSQQKIIQSRAANSPIVFKGDNVAQRNSQWVALKSKISLELTSSLGAPGAPATSSALPIPTPASTSGDVSFILDSAQVSKPFNETFNVSFKLNAGSFNISAVDVTLSFDKEKLELINFVPSSESRIDQIINEKNNLSGSWRFTGVRSASVARVSGEVNLGILQFKTKSLAGVAQLNFGDISATSSDRAGPLTAGAQGGIVQILPATTTSFFRVAENPTDLAAALLEPYTAEPTLRDFEFKDQTPGLKTIFVEFQGSSDASVRHQASIRLLGEPSIASCLLSFEGSNTIITLTAEKSHGFGANKGLVKSDETELQVKEWKNNRVKAVWPNAPEGQALPVTLTDSDGQVAESQCSAISQLSVGARFFCGQTAAAAVSNVDLVLAGAFDTGTKTKQKVSIDTSGVITGLTQKLEEGKNYKLSLKAPRSLRRTAEFTAGNGTTNVNNFVLPVGDIFPALGDGVINSLDRAELVRQWIVAIDAAGRTADFNQDGRVNSVDWACMRHDFGSSDDSEPAAGGPAAAAAPSSSPSPAASTASSPSPSQSSTPTPTPAVSPSPAASP
ncbi:hypothetical protein HY383_03530 [Candidatus Daviesbacteria bacterium]|nr:hypothetical protein [Candidatus Daviesbacteria bacterium]